MNINDFGNFICTLRKEKNLTQKELAQMLDVTDKAVSRWETAKNYPDIETLEKLARALGISINELLECRRIPPEDIAEASEKQIVEQIKTNRRSKKKYRAIIAIALIISVISSGYFALLANGVFNGVIYNEIECYSNDLLTVLHNIDGYIKQRPKADGELIISDGWIFLDENKNTSDFHLDGTCRNGRNFYVDTLLDNSSRYCSVNEMRKNIDPVEGIPMSDLISLINQLDLSEFPTPEKYHIWIYAVQDYENQDLYLNEYQASKKKLIFADGILRKYPEKTLSGKYFYISLDIFYHGSAFTVADIYYKL
ncbi:MAG: helix-turn-helix transcriptional regulator [Clostridia bacterium]|nr:helix-turn-helix transcriptional regulator [Clostridia bacterium]